MFAGSIVDTDCGRNALADHPSLVLSGSRKTLNRTLPTYPAQSQDN